MNQKLSGRHLWKVGQPESHMLRHDNHGKAGVVSKVQTGALGLPKKPRLLLVGGPEEDLTGEWLFTLTEDGGAEGPSRQRALRTDVQDWGV